MGAFKNIQSFQISASNPADPAAECGNFQNSICARAEILARDWESAQQRVVEVPGCWKCSRGFLCVALPPVGAKASLQLVSTSQLSLWKGLGGDM